MLQLVQRDKIVIDYDNQYDKFSFGVVCKDRYGYPYPYYVLEYDEEHVVIDKMGEDKITWSFKNQKTLENGTHRIVLSNLYYERVIILYEVNIDRERETPHLEIEVTQNNRKIINLDIVSTIGEDPVGWKVIKTNGIIPFKVYPLEFDDNGRLSVEGIAKIEENTRGYITIKSKGDDITKNVFIEQNMKTNKLKMVGVE